MRILYTDDLKSLSAIYQYDSMVKIKGSTEVTVDGYKLNTAELFNSVQNIEITEHSAAVLTSCQSLTSIVETIYPNNTKRFITWIKHAPTGSFLQKDFNDWANFSTDITSKNILEIIFLDEFRAQICYNDNNILKYLTYDPIYGSALFFTASSNNFEFQKFFYFFDKVENQITFYLIVNGVTYSIVNFANSLKISPNSFSSDALFTVRNYNIIPSLVTNNNNWVSYDTDLNNKDLVISNNKTYKNINNNYLSIFNFYNIDLNNSTYSINFLPLKNQLTDDNRISRANPYNSELDIDHRLYYSFQIEGNDIILNYTSDVKQIFIPKDKLTYFRFPYICSPFLKLNIQDSSLIKCGAIAGDIPINSDKIFKQRTTDYKEYSITDEQNGTWLCAWLSGNPTPGSDPIWVDRYYNPNFLTSTNALLYSTVPFYTDSITNIIKETKNENQIIFDLPSKLVFEPHALYAYHHLGNTDLLKLLRTKEYGLLTSAFDVYKNSNNTSFVPFFNDYTNVYDFDNSKYAITSITPITGSFTLSFKLFSNNFSQQFTNNILSNSNILITNELSSIKVNIQPTNLNADQLILSYNLSGLNTGWYNFSVIFNTEKGYSDLYVEEFKVDSVSFEPDKYNFSTILKNPLSAGSLSAIDENFKLKDLRIYNLTLSPYDIRNISFVYSDIQDIFWYMPTGQRNYLDTIERFFKMSPPGHKSNSYNIIIQNSNIVDANVKAAVEYKIRSLVETTSPVYTQLNQITWRENV